MKINLAVYTATEGYSWQTGTRILNSDLIEYKKIIGRFPDPTVDTLPFGGAFVYHNKVVFYRFHIAKQADSKGRDALYLILGECPKNIAMKIDFNSLFAKTEMASPSNPFPFELDYIGAPSPLYAPSEAIRTRYQELSFRLYQSENRHPQRCRQSSRESLRRNGQEEDIP